MSNKQAKAEIYNNEITEIENIDESTDNGTEEQYPWDPKRIRVDTKSMSLRQVMEMIDDGDLDLAPDFQRKKVWNHSQKSSLIESLCLRIPIPVFYFSSDLEGIFQVVDGLQRLSTIHDFVNDGFALVNLRYLEELKGLKFSDLKDDKIIWKKYINLTQFVVNIIDRQTPPKVKFDIFRRINTGGNPLTDQEIRHCLSTPENRKMLAEMAADEFFKKNTRGKLTDNTRMLDRELVLRFCALMITEKKVFGEINDNKIFINYSNLTSYLDESNELINEKINQKQRQELIDYWHTSCRNAYEVFGEFSYTKMKTRLFNKAVFECLSVEMAFCDYKKIVKYKKKIKNDYENLLECKLFFNSISAGTHSEGRFNLRFQKIHELLEQYQ